MTDGVIRQLDVFLLLESTDFADIDDKQGDGSEELEDRRLEPPGLLIIGNVIPFSVRYLIATGPISNVLAINSANC